MNATNATTMAVAARCNPSLEPLRSNAVINSSLTLAAT
jgi:hypothetical protein